MVRDRPVLHMVCGKVGSGKSTLCAVLARTPGSVLVAQDPWMAKLYPDELQTLADYGRLVVRLRAVMGPHLAELLRAELSIVLDWPANTPESRAWMRGIFESGGAAHRLHVLDTPDEVCLARLHARNAGGQHEYVVSDAEFAALGRHYRPPTAAEGFDVLVHAWCEADTVAPPPL